MTNAATSPVLQESPPQGEVQVTVVLPCLNEAATLSDVIMKARGWAEARGLTLEIIVADNGSTDGSKQIAERCGASVIDVPIKGYGAALTAGILAAHSEFVVMGDSDDSYDFSQLDPFYEHLRLGADLVVGNRFLGGIAPGAMPWKNRYVGNPALTLVGRLLYARDVRDFHCGLRAVRKAAFRQMETRTTGMEFASEMIVRASALGMSIVEVPTTLSRDGRGREPHLRPWRDGWRHLRFLLACKPTALFIAPGSIVACIGTLAYLALWRGPVTVRTITFDIHTLLVSQALIGFGLALILAGLLAIAIGTRDGFLPARRYTAVVNQALAIAGPVGATLMVLGALAGVLAVTSWSVLGFGPITGTGTLRLVSASTLTLSLGATLLVTSFLRGLLLIPTRRS